MTEWTVELTGPDVAVTLTTTAETAIDAIANAMALVRANSGVSYDVTGIKAWRT